MKNETLENILSDYVNKNYFKGRNHYILDEELVNFFKPLIDDEEDLEEAINIVINSKKFNHITLENGTGYLTTKEIGDLTELVAILPEKGDFWRNDYISVNGEKYSMTWLEFNNKYKGRGSNGQSICINNRR